LASSDTNSTAGRRKRVAANLLGSAAEAWVANLMYQAGWNILGRNVRVGGAELDIIAELRGDIRFVEVKARTTDDALEAITADKRARLTRGARAWLADYDHDVVTEATFSIALVSPTEPMSVEWWHNAFDAA